VIPEIVRKAFRLARLEKPSATHIELPEDVAVEPVEGMWRVLHDALPRVPLLAVTAEGLSFEDALLDAVTVAQGFHWFDAETALAELQRVLRPNNQLNLI